MTQEEKELLIKDLCARLPYHINMWHMTNVWADYKFVRKNVSIEQLTKDNITKIDDNFKPYLRPMSSMTEEEKMEYAIAWSSRQPYLPTEAMDWLNKHHFDYRGLIPMGLALEAPEGMYCAHVEFLDDEAMKKLEDSMYDKDGWKDLGGGLKMDRNGNIAGGLKIK